MARGDHIFARRPLLYTHHGIDCGDGYVIHYTGEIGSKANAAVRRTPLEDFLADAEEARIVKYEKCDAPDTVVARAESRLREKKYRLLFNNCEHFATWCKTGKKRSGQVVIAVTVAASVVAVAASGVMVKVLMPSKKQ